MPVPIHPSHKVGQVDGPFIHVHLIPKRAHHECDGCGETFRCVGRTQHQPSNYCACIKAVSSVVFHYCSFLCMDSDLMETDEE